MERNETSSELFMDSFRVEYAAIVQIIVLLRLAALKQNRSSIATYDNLLHVLISPGKAPYGAINLPVALTSQCVIICVLCFFSP